MRVIGGKLKGRRFDPPADNWPTRPTTDMAREALFNILNNLLDFEETKALDLFGGTGGHCYELVSRGCTNVTYVDNFALAVRFVRKTADTFGIDKNVTIQQMDVFHFLKHCTTQFDYIFADPPHSLPTLDTIPDLIFEKDLLLPDGLFVLEHNPYNDFLNHPQLVDVRTYGKTVFSFFRP